MAMPKTPKNNYEDISIVQHPSSLNVNKDSKVILYKPDGTALVRPIGFK